MATSLSTHKKYPLPGVTIHDSRMADMQAVKTALVSIDSDIESVTKQFSLRANFPGAVTTMAGTIRNYPNAPFVVNSITAWTSSNPTVDLVIAVRKNGNVEKTFTLASTVSKTTVSVSPAISLTSNDYLTVDIVSGSGSDLIVRLDQ